MFVVWVNKMLYSLFSRKRMHILYEVESVEINDICDCYVLFGNLEERCMQFVKGSLRSSNG